MEPVMDAPRYVGEMVVLVNRTAGPIEVVQNGRQITLQPGPNHITSDWVRFARMQHPRMGTFDPSGLQGEYLVGLEGVDDCSPIPPGDEHKSVERFDRSQMDDVAREAVTVRTGVNPPIRRVPGDGHGVPVDAGFSGRDR